jgi:hypothetical protein
MRDVDLVRVRQLLSNIAEAQSQLRELGQLSEAEFLRISVIPKVPISSKDQYLVDDLILSRMEIHVWN